MAKKRVVVEIAAPVEHKDNIAVLIFAHEQLAGMEFDIDFYREPDMSIPAKPGKGKRPVKIFGEVAEDKEQALRGHEIVIDVSSDPGVIINALTRK